MVLKWACTMGWISVQWDLQDGNKEAGAGKEAQAVKERAHLLVSFSNNYLRWDLLQSLEGDAIGDIE